MDGNFLVWYRVVPIIGKLTHQEPKWVLQQCGQGSHFVWDSNGLPRRYDTLKAATQAATELGADFVELPQWPL